MSSQIAVATIQFVKPSPCVSLTWVVQSIFIRSRLNDMSILILVFGANVVNFKLGSYKEGDYT